MFVEPWLGFFTSEEVSITIQPVNGFPNPGIMTLGAGDDHIVDVYWRFAALATTLYLNEGRRVEIR